MKTTPKILTFLALLLPLILLSGCGASSAPDVPAGKVLIEEFGDFQCPSCAAVEPILAKVRERFPNEVVFRFVHFPLPQHDKAFHAAEAGECARADGDEKFLAFGAKLFKNQSKLTDETFLDIAQQVGLDKDAFQQCLDAGTTTAIVRKNMKEGTKRGVNSTPTVFVNGKKLESNRYEAIVKEIEAVLPPSDAPKTPEDEKDSNTSASTQE